VSSTTAPGEQSPFDVHVEGVVSPGFGHASGTRSTKYPEGTINLQRPHFLALGLDIRHCHAGTINLSIAPRTYRVRNPEFVLREVLWKPERRPENFFIGRCRIARGKEHWIDGFIYFPDPSTKESTRDDPSHFQLLAPYIPAVAYGDRLGMRFRSSEFELLGSPA
jgi:hypothetical protein